MFSKYEVQKVFLFSADHVIGDRTVNEEKHVDDDAEYTTQRYCFVPATINSDIVNILQRPEFPQPSFRDGPLEGWEQQDPQELRDQKKITLMLKHWLLLPRC